MYTRHQSYSGLGKGVAGTSKVICIVKSLKGAVPTEAIVRMSRDVVPTLKSTAETSK